MRRHPALSALDGELVMDVRCAPFDAEPRPATHHAIAMPRSMQLKKVSIHTVEKNAALPPRRARHARWRSRSISGELFATRAAGARPCWQTGKGTVASPPRGLPTKASSSSTIQKPPPIEYSVRSASGGVAAASSAYARKVIALECSGSKSFRL